MAISAGVSPQRRQRIEREQATSLLGQAIDFPFPQICAAWGVPDLGPEFRSPVRSEVPALFISGTLDTRTPMSDATEVRRHFSRGVQVTIVGAGHGDDLILSAPEIRQTILRFLSGQAVSDIRIAPPVLQPDHAGASSLGGRRLPINRRSRASR
jgi:pimeloyl-ACP methyl ester carboxylesterase